jgi:hypothetical protein
MDVFPYCCAILSSRDPHRTSSTNVWTAPWHALARLVKCDISLYTSQSKYQGSLNTAQGSGNREDGAANNNALSAALSFWTPVRPLSSPTGRNLKLPVTDRPASHRSTPSSYPGAVRDMPVLLPLLGLSCPKKVVS